MPSIRSEGLAYWYLRLNGFLTIVNFIVHPEVGDEQRTDADVVGIRFPNRAELGQPNPMQDDERLVGVENRSLLLIAEAKRGICDLNGPWTDPHAENMERVLRAIGVYPEREISQAANAVYHSATYASSSVELRLACFGSAENPHLQERYPQLLQLSWADVLRFIYHRFRQECPATS